MYKRATSSGETILYFSHINLLRAFAALSVLFYHIIELYPWKDFPVEPKILLWFRTGWMGVDLFFVISGFVIFLSAIRLYETPNVKSPKKIFIKRRFARIVPLYIFTAMVFVIFNRPEIMVDPSFFRHLLTHLTFTHNLFPATHGSINGPNWSVAAEFQFYFLVFLGMAFLARIKPGILLVSGVLIAIISRALLFFAAEKMGWDAQIRFQYATQVITMMDEFAFGMFLAKMATRKSKGFTLSPVQNPFKAKVFWSALFLFLVLVTLTMKIYWHTPDYWNNAFMVIVWRSLLGLSFALLLALAVLLPTTRFTRNPVYRLGYYLGDISYGIYLWHLPVLLAVKQAGIQDPIRFSVVTILCVIIMSMFSWHLLEKPIIRKFK